jgi:hypothetical protein
MPRFLFLLGAVLALAGCGSTGDNTGLESLRSFAVDDLTRAHAIAVAAEDGVAANCYAALLDMAENTPGLPDTDVGRTGGFTVFQVGRNISRRVAGGVPEKVHVACAPLVVDAETTLLGLGAIGAR